MPLHGNWVESSLIYMLTMTIMNNCSLKQPDFYTMSNDKKPIGKYVKLKIDLTSLN